MVARGVIIGIIHGKIGIEREKMVDGLLEMNRINPTKLHILET
jgi:hypothetical protein